MPAEWGELLEASVRHYRHLPPRQRELADKVVLVFVAEKDWAGAGQLDVTLAMKLTIAGYAAVMASGLDEPYYFDRLETIVIQRRGVRFNDAGVIRNPYLPDDDLVGVAWHHGPVLISWSEVRRQQRGADRGGNVILHELAHHVDGLDGHVDGAPPMTSRTGERRWYEVTAAEFRRLVGQARRGEATLLDHYGATNRAEFFAVATECFFELPHELREEHRSLYDVLADFYRQDPAAWLPDPAFEL